MANRILLKDQRLSITGRMTKDEFEEQQKKYKEMQSRVFATTNATRDRMITGTTQPVPSSISVGEPKPTNIFSKALQVLGSGLKSSISKNFPVPALVGQQTGPGSTQQAVYPYDIEVKRIDGVPVPTRKYAPSFREIEEASKIPQEEGLIQTFKEGWQTGVLNTQLGQEYWKMMRGQPNKAAELEERARIRTDLQPAVPTDWSRPSSIIKAAVRGLAEQIPMWMQSIKEGQTQGALSAGAGALAALAGGQLGPQAAIPEEVLTVPGAAAIGYGVGAVKGSMDFMRRLEGGHAYKEYIDNGINPETAKLLAETVGLVNAAIEQAQIGAVLKTIPGGNVLLGQLKNKIVSEAGKSLARRLASGALNYGKFLAEETLEEVIQEAVTIAGNEIGAQFEGIEGIGGSNILDRLKETAAHSALSFALMPIPGAVASGVSSAVANRRAGQAGPITALEAENQQPSSMQRVDSPTQQVEQTQPMQQAEVTSQITQQQAQTEAVKNVSEQVEEQDSMARTVQILRDYIEKAEKAKLKELEQAQSVNSIIKAIRDHGGIKIKEGNAFFTEYKETIPKNIRSQISRRTGVPIDEMANQLGMTVVDLIQQVADEARNKTQTDHLTRIRDYLYQNDPDYKDAVDMLSEIENERFKRQEQVAAVEEEVVSKQGIEQPTTDQTIKQPEESAVIQQEVRQGQQITDGAQIQPVEAKTEESQLPQITVTEKSDQMEIVEQSKPSFKEGDRVEWLDNNGNRLTGTIRSIGSPDDPLISINTDQIKHAGGVPIGRIEMVRKDNPTLRLIERKEQEQQVETPVKKQDLQSIQQQQQQEITDVTQQEGPKATETTEVQNQEFKLIYPGELKKVTLTETVRGFGVPYEYYEWYAKVKGTHPQYVFDRTFLKKDKDYTYFDGVKRGDIIEHNYNKRKGRRYYVVNGIEGQTLELVEISDLEAKKIVTGEVKLDLSNKQQAQQEQRLEQPQKQETALEQQQQDVVVDQAQDVVELRQEEPLEKGEKEDGSIQRTSPPTPEGIQAKDVRGNEKEREPRKLSEQLGEELQGSAGDNEREALGSESTSGGMGLSEEGTAPAVDRDDSARDDKRDTTAIGRTRPGRVEQPITGNNFRITPEHGIGEGGPKAKYKDNVAAIRLVKQLEAEGRLATSEEQAILAKYVGWGGLPQVFDFDYRGNPRNEQWKNEALELKELLDKDEYEAARQSTQNAHYTSTGIIKAMYEALEHFGFKGGNILEPAMGIGNFFGMLPESLSKSKLVGVEKDKISGLIAKYLYPKADVRIEGFEETALPDNFFDVAISNVPFGDIRINDPKYKFGFMTRRIHNYFFVKSLDKVRPGGLIMFITSTGTMNASDVTAMQIREYLAKHADLIGAVRLPGDAFKKNALTEVTTDIIILQKRSEDAPARGQKWLKTVEDGPFRNNEYFVKHPEMMLGKVVEDKLYPGRMGLESDGRNLEESLREAFKKLPANIITKTEPSKTKALTEKDIIQASKEVKQGAFVIENGKIYQRQGDVMVEISAQKGKAAERIKGMIGLKAAVKDLLNAQILDKPDAEIKALQVKLNNLYDSFVKQHGYINDSANSKVFSEDPEYLLLTQLEKKQGNDKYVKADIFTKRTIVPNKVITSADTAAEALNIVLNETGKVDLARITELTGKTEQEVINELKGLIYKNPQGTWESASEYLSGNVRAKLAVAKEAAAIDPAYKDNVEALEKVQPKDLEAHQIKARLGASWIPPEDVKAFIGHLLDISGWRLDGINVRYVPLLAQWTVDASNADYSVTNSHKNLSEYGINARGATALDLIEKALNMQKPTVYKTVDDKRVVDVKATTVARAKQKQIANEFQKWVFSDQERRERLVAKYNWEFNNTVLREYDGSYLTLPGINPLMPPLRKHQLNAISRIIQTGNTLLAHVVGAGKTAVMIAAGMETKRLGLVKKNLYVVPNHLTGQFANDFMQWYPNAKILVATKKDFEAKNRKKLIAKVATGDWDAVIIGHSQLIKIPLSTKTEEEFIRKEIAQVEEALLLAKEEDESESRYAIRKKKSTTVKQLEKTKQNLEVKLKSLLQDTKRDDIVTFEELGVDQIFVDEAHEFKNLFLYTKMGRVPGISTSSSQRARDLFMKTQYISNLNGGSRGVVFATGTPVSNSMTEVYTMMRYLQMKELEKMGLSTFDAWASMFGETVSDVEIDPTGTKFRTKERFSRFFNVPELVTMFRKVADIKMLNDLPEIKAARPGIVGGKPEIISVEPNKELKEYIASLVERTEQISKGKIDPREDNMLKVTNDGRNAALDLRLVDIWVDDPGSKLNKCIDNVFNIWEKTKKDKLTQLIFSDLGTPKDQKKAAKTDEYGSGEGEFAVTFDVYNEIKRKLVLMGVPAKEIAFIHEANNDAQKEEMFAKVRTGEIRILLGSTRKMGAGTNVQNRLVAVHHIDAPWKPSDIEQRDGRILRPGNMNKEVYIMRYVTKGSFDAYLWQMIERKASFIGQVMNGDPNIREMQDVDSAALEAAEVKAAAVENPLIGEKIKIDSELNQLRVLQTEYLSRVYRAQDELKQMPAKQQNIKETIASLEKDIKLRDKNNTGEFKIKIGKNVYTERKQAGEALFVAIKKAVESTAKNDPDPKGFSSVVIGEYMGFELSVNISPVTKEFMQDKNIATTDNCTVSLKGSMTHRTDVSDSDLGTITKIENVLKKLEARVELQKKLLENLAKEEKALKETVNTPWEQAERFEELTKRSQEIDAELNLGQYTEVVMGEDADSDSDKLEEIESALAEEIDAATESINVISGKLGIVAPGFSLRGKAANVASINNTNVTFDNPEIEAQYQASKNLLKDSFYARVRTWLGKAWHKATREFEHLPHTGEFAPLRNALLNLAKQKEIQGERTLYNLRGIVLHLDKKQYDIFNRKVLLDDLMEEVKAGHELPFGFTKDELETEWQKFTALANADEAIADAIAKRDKLWEAIKSSYIKAMKDIGFDAENRLSRKNYFRHVVLEFAGAYNPAVTGTGKKLKAPTSRGYLKERHGSAKNILSDYLKAEYEIMAKMLYDIRVAKTIKLIDDKYNVINKLKKLAKRANEDAMKRLYAKEKAEMGATTDRYGNLVSPTEETMNRYKAFLAMSFSQLESMAEDGNLWDGENGEFADVVTELSTKGRSLANSSDDNGRLFKYLRALLDQKDENGNSLPGAIQAATILKYTTARRELMKESLGKNYKTWRDVIPDGYAIWQPREGNILYVGHTISEDDAAQLLEDIILSLNISKDDLQKHLILGGKRTEFVLKQEIVDTLNNLTKPADDNVLTKLQKAWKVWTLLSPRRSIKYNLRNISGDLDAILMMRPGALKYVPQVINELVDVYIANKPMSKEMLEWFKRGGMSATLQVAELGDIDHLRIFAKQLEAKGSVKEIPQKVWHSYWKAVRMSSDLREAVLRYAAYLSYLEDMQKHKGIPSDFGASIKEEILALDDIRDRAYWLSNDLLGAYDKVSVFGQGLRKYIAPFWSWNEVNFRRYVQAVKNAADDGKLATAVGMTLLKGTKASAMIAFRVGKLAIMSSGLWVLLTLYNNTFFPDEEDDLPEEEKKKPHIIFGRDEDGNVLYFNRLGALQDFVDWFGIDAGTVSQVKDVLNGRKTLSEVALEMAKSPVNKILSAVGPLFKIPAELVYGKKITLSGDVSDIRDKALYVADSLGLGSEYRALMNIPSKPYKETLKDIIVYTDDPERTAYYAILDAKHEFQKKIGKGSTGSFRSPKNDALYYFKQALYYKDKEAARKYLLEYAAYGGTKDGLERSLEALNPLYGLNNKDEAAFVKSLDEKQRQQLKKAFRYYKRVINNFATIKSWDTDEGK